MKKFIIDAIKVVIPFALGIYLVWYFFSSLTSEDIDSILYSFKTANYWWIGISTVFALLSHASRAYRWNYALEPLGYQPKFLNNFFAVMAAYLVNLAVPRLGELTRCGVIAQYEKVPFNKLLGTVIAERVADFLILITITLVVVWIQFEVIQDLIYQLLDAMFGGITSQLLYIIIAFVLIVSSLVIYLLLFARIQSPITIKIRKMVFGLIEGLISIFKMKRSGAFLFHTFFIWAMYLLMFTLCFYSLPETANVPFGGILTSFVLGGFTIALTNGGIGAYPIAVQSVLLLYAVDKNTGGAFGWIVWTAQTVLLIVMGIISFALLPYYNKKLNSKIVVNEPT